MKRAVKYILRAISILFIVAIVGLIGWLAFDFQLIGIILFPIYLALFVGLIVGICELFEWAWKD